MLHLEAGSAADSGVRAAWEDAPGRRPDCSQGGECEPVALGRLCAQALS